MGGKLTGRVEILLNGEALLNKEGAKITGVGESGKPPYEREAIMGDTGLHGYTEKPIIAGCEVTVSDRDDVLLDKFARINGDGTIIFRAARGGKVYIMEGATCLNNMELTAGEGEVTLRFQGPYWTEQVSVS